jgi:hypothetical protein
MTLVSRILHYLALILGFQVSLFFTLFLIAEGGAGLLEGKTSVLPILILMIISVGGYLFALSNPRKGGIIMITGGLLMMVYLLITGGMGEYKMSLIYGLPFIVPGLVLFFNRRKEFQTEKL